MKKYILLVTIIFIAGFVLSCSEDNLDIPQKGVLSTGYYNTAGDDEANVLIASIYSSAFSAFSPQSLMLTLFAMGGDGYVGSTWEDMPTIKKIERFQGIPSTSNYASWFSAFYQINYRCNMIIENMEGDSDYKKQVISEAYALRAWSYMWLIQLWGTPPLVDHVLASDELQPSNGNPDELWDYVESSFEEAVKNLPSKTNKDGQEEIGGRLTKETVYALWGKAKLKQGDYSGAATMLKDYVIDTDLYELWSDYSTLFRPAADFCAEFLWEYNCAENPGSNYNRGYNRTFVSWRHDQINAPKSTGSGYGFGCCYTPDFVTFIKQHDAPGGVKDIRYLSILKDYDEIVAWADEALNAANGTNINSVGIKDGQGETSLIKAFPYTNSVGYWGLKFFAWKEDAYSQNVGQQSYLRSNVALLRYSEVLLMYSEALAQQGQSTGNGLDALNLVRERAGLPALASYTLQDVKDEKRVELVRETGERFLDLIRWGETSGLSAEHQYQIEGYAADGSWVISEYVGNTGIAFVPNKHELFPFPESEILANPNLIQNPGY